MIAPQKLEDDACWSKDRLLPAESLSPCQDTLIYNAEDDTGKGTTKVFCKLTNTILIKIGTPNFISNSHTAQMLTCKRPIVQFRYSLERSQR